MLNFNTITEESDYNSLRFKLISGAEEKNHIKLLPYLDPKFIPSIGVGMNLRVKKIFDEFVVGILGVQKSEPYYNKIKKVILSPYTDQDKLIIDLDAIMLDRASDNSIVGNKRASFSFLDTSEVATVFETITPIYEAKIDTWWNDDLNQIPKSYERLALFSLAYNQQDTKPLLKPDGKLLSAMHAGNRADAWYEIRYQSNKDNLPGLAERRYFESDVFGLYDDRSGASVTTEESESVLQMYSKHATYIKEYDARKWGKDKKYTYSDQIAAANVEIYLPELSPKVKGIAESLYRARQTVVSNYLPLGKVNQILISSGLDDVLVGARSKSDAVVLPLKSTSTRNQQQLQSQQIQQKAKTKSLASEDIANADNYYSPAIEGDDTYYSEALIADDDVEEISDFPSTLMIGKSSTDTFYLPSIAGDDYITSSVNDGAINIGGIKLSGNADPKTGANGETYYSLSNYDLHQVGSDLVVCKLGADVSSASTPRITIKSFPFTQSTGAFGITLGKKMDKTAGIKTVTKSLPNLLSLPLGGFPSGASVDKFFGITRQLRADGSNNELEADSIAMFDSFGNQISSKSLDEVFNKNTDADSHFKGLKASSPSSYLCTISSNGKKYYLLGASSMASFNKVVQSQDGRSSLDRIFYSQVGALLLDTAGNVVSSQIYDQGSFSTLEAAGTQFYSFGFSISEDQNDLYIYYERDSKSGPYDDYKEEMVFQKIDKNSLGKIGEPISYSSSYWSEHASVITGSNHFSLFYPEYFTLASGTKIQISDRRTITSSIPQLRDLLPSEIIPNHDLAAGDQKTDTSLSKAILAFNADEETKLSVTSNPNSQLALLGTSQNSNAKISLPVASNSEVQIYSVKSSDYSLDDLLDGKFNTAAATPIDVNGGSSARRRNRRLDATLDANGNVTNLFNSTAGNSTDDGFYYYGDGATAVDDDLTTDDVTNDDVDLSDSEQLFTLLILPNNQTIILAGVNATELAKTPQNYYSMSLTPTPSLSPTSSKPSVAVPTRKPTTQPISFMTNYLLPVATGSQVSNEFDGTNHFGIDFAVSSGSSVKAINAGLVIRKIANHPKFGNVLIIDQGDGTAALYAHLSSFGTTNVGDEIAQGSEIALSGATANGTQHLHLEIISGSTAISTIANSADPEIGIDDNADRTNPRPLFNTRYTDAEFTRTVLGTEGDSRDNKVKDVDGASDTILYGNAGNDKYFFDFTKDGGYLATHYTISDTDLDGEIEVAYGDGSYVTLEGNARAKTDNAGNVIANNWVFSQGFEAKLDGSDLVIFKAGADITDDSVGRISIENYAGSRAFGFTLGKTADLAADGTSITGYDSKTASLTENRRFLGGTFFFVKKYLARGLAIASLASALLIGNFAAAQSNKAATQSKNIESSVEDPDLKLSIEELKKKYPITWFAKKYEKRDIEYCDGEEQSAPYISSWPCGPLCSNFPNDTKCPKACYDSFVESNMMCSFFETKSYAKGAPKSGWLISIDFFSESEIKSLLVEYVRQTIDSKNWKQSDWDNNDDRAQQFYAYILYYFYDVNPNPTSEKEIRVKKFINSEIFTSLLKNSVNCRYLKSVYRIKNLSCLLELENKSSSTKSK